MIRAAQTERCINETICFEFSISLIGVRGIGALFDLDEQSPVRNKVMALKST